MLWLGVRLFQALSGSIEQRQANVMLEYTTDEAHDLIEDKLASARRALAAAEEDLDWLRDQATVVEVNIARLHNHGVLAKRIARTVQS